MPSASPDSFAGRLHLTRVCKGLSQQSLAAMLGTSQQQLSTYESGEVTFRTRMMMNLATCLEVRRDWLADGQGPMSEVGAEVGVQSPKLITKVLVEGQTAITFVLSVDLRNSLAARARSDGLTLDELLVAALLELGQGDTKDKQLERAEPGRSNADA